MLVLERKLNERIILRSRVDGSEISIKVVRLCGEDGNRKVLLDIVADQEWNIIRAELEEGDEVQKT